MPKYDASQYDPPAPTAEVFLRDVRTGSLVTEVILLIDTGAETTLLPRVAVERLGVALVVGVSAQLMAFNGTKSVVPTVDLDMIFLGKAYRGRYLVIDDNHGILGRDVLVNAKILLDGPNQEWSEQTSV